MKKRPQLSGATPAVSPPKTPSSLSDYQTRRCTIVLDAEKGMDVTFEPPLPDEPHRVNWVEAAAANALIGIGQSLTNKGRGQVLTEMHRFAREAGRKGAA